MRSSLLERGSWPTVRGYFLSFLLLRRQLSNTRGQRRSQHGIQDGTIFNEFWLKALFVSHQSAVKFCVILDERRVSPVAVGREIIIHINGSLILMDAFCAGIVLARFFLFSGVHKLDRSGTLYKIDIVGSQSIATVVVANGFDWLLKTRIALQQVLHLLLLVVVVTVV
jgi:hypothetical protein